MSKVFKSLLAELFHPFRALRFSCEGLVSAIRGEAAFRHELILGGVHLLAAFLVEMPLGARLCLVLSWFMLLSVELLNTAVESLADKVSPEWSAFAKRAKDCGSAAVACVLAGMFALWACVAFSKVL